MSALLDKSDMLFFTKSQCLSFCSHICYFKQESATHSHMEVKNGFTSTTFQLHSQLMTEQLIRLCGFTKQRWQGSDFSDQQGQRKLYRFLVVLKGRSGEGGQATVEEREVSPHGARQDRSGTFSRPWWVTDQCVTY
jgi:hypothetical protein